MATATPTPTSAQNLEREVTTDVKNAIASYNDLSKLLSVAPACVASIATLMRIATSGDDFELLIQGDLMEHKSFTMSLVQLTNWVCSAFMLADAKFEEIKTNTEIIPGTVRDMLENIEDTAYLNEAAEGISNIGTMCYEIADKVSQEFTQVKNLISQIFEMLFYTKTNLNGLTPKTLYDIQTALKDGLSQLAHFSERWNEISKYFIIIISKIGDATQLRSKHKYFAAKAIKVSLIGVRIIMLAAVYQEISKQFLETPVRLLSSYIADAKNNHQKFVDLAVNCEKTEETIGTIISTQNSTVQGKLEQVVKFIRGEADDWDTDEK